MYLNYAVNNYVNLEIMLINLTCIIEPKYTLVGITLRFDYGVKVRCFLVLSKNERPLIQD